MIQIPSMTSGCQGGTCLQPNACGAALWRMAPCALALRMQLRLWQRRHCYRTTQARDGLNNAWGMPWVAANATYHHATTPRQSRHTSQGALCQHSTKEHEGAAARVDAPGAYMTPLTRLWLAPRAPWGLGGRGPIRGARPRKTWHGGAERKGGEHSSRTRPSHASPCAPPKPAQGAAFTRNGGDGRA